MNESALDYMADYVCVSTGIHSNCPECMDRSGITGPRDFIEACDNGGIDAHITFTNARCEICNGLPGKRYFVHGKWVYGNADDGEPIAEPGITHLEVCEDCWEVIRNG